MSFFDEIPEDKYKISENLKAKLNVEKIVVAFIEYEDATGCSAYVHIYTYSNEDHEFYIKMGNPKTVKDTEEILLKGLIDYLGEGNARRDIIADAYFRKHIEEISITGALDYANEIIEKLKSMIKIVNNDICDIWW